MSTKWWAACLLSFAFGVASLVTGSRVSGLGNFYLNMLAEFGGLFIAFGIAVLLIEGPFLTRERQRRKYVASVANSVMQLSGGVGIILARELAQSLNSELKTHVDLYGEERSDWSKFRPLLSRIFDQARNVSSAGDLVAEGRLTREEYLSHVTSVRSWVSQVRERLGTRFEVEVELSTLVKKIDVLDSQATLAVLPSSQEDEFGRFRWIGTIGEAIIDVAEAGHRVSP